MPVNVAPANAAFASNAACKPVVLAIVKEPSVIVDNLASKAVCNPVVLAIVKEPSVIVSCFDANLVINEVPASITFGVVMFPRLLMYPLVFKSPDAATVKVMPFTERIGVYTPPVAVKLYDDTLPVNVAPASDAFAFNAACVNDCFIRIRSIIYIT